MALSNSVIRRYTPPTCTLQILAPSSSPLSRWVGRSVLKQVRFDLRFDDPRLPEEQRVAIQGDREQLEALHEAVTTYVQNLLNQSPERFNAILPALTPPYPGAAVSSNPGKLDLIASDSQAVSDEPRRLDASDTSANLELEQIAPKKAIATLGGKIFLQPNRGLSHDLLLGPLATEETGSVIHLSVLQLFDLATALDEYAADNEYVAADVAVPTSRRPRSAPASRAWASIAAILLLAAGLATAVFQLFKGSDSQQLAVNRNANQASSGNTQQPIARQPSPLPSLSSPEILPSLPPIPNITPSPSASLPSLTIPQQTPALKGAPQPNIPQTAPAIPGAPQANLPRTAPVIPIPSITPAPPILINPSPRQDGSLFIPGAATTPETSVTQPPSSSITQPSAAIPSPSPQLTTPNPELDAALSQAIRGTAPAPEPSITPTPQQSSDSASQTLSRSTSTTPNKPNATAFDTIPQVAEVRDYFNQRWEPPSTLKQALEYSLVLDVDGTIQRIEPLGQAARNYVDRTGMPLIGESFVSPNKSGQTPRIRVVLNPDGKVQTFLEAAN